MRLLTILLIVFALGNCIVAKKAENKTFIATNVWQEIEEGQQIPRGLHVRINLKTGKKEAKLLNESENLEQEQNTSTASGGSSSSGSSLATMPENASEAPPKRETLVTSKDRAKIAKQLNKAFLDKSLQLEHSRDEMEQIQQRFRTYGEIKDSITDIRKNFKTDGEIITLLIGEYRNLTEADVGSVGVGATAAALKQKKQMRILEKFYFMVDQIDNAQYFINAGGLEHILLPLLVNQTNVALRVQSMQVLGALTQNNPKAQVKVFELNFGGHLSQILITSSNTEELSSALYAFGGLLRKFPHAQLRILSTTGTQALVTLLSKECDLKLKAKAATLISDIVVEKKLAQDHAHSDNSFATLGAAQYALLNFSDWLHANEFCKTFDALISTQLYELLAQPDLVEYFLEALQNTHEYCQALWSKSADMRHTLLTLQNRYLQSKDEYREELATNIKKLIVALYEPLPHDEL